MNLARFFSYTRSLEEARDQFEQLLRELQEEHASCEDNAREAAAIEVQAAVKGVSDRYELELGRERDDYLLLREQYEKLLDRFLLLNRSVPISEPLLTPAAAANPGNTERVSNLLDQSNRRTGPVATARQKAENEFVAQQVKRETAGRRVPEHHLATSNAEPLPDNLGEVMAE